MEAASAGVVAAQAVGAACGEKNLISNDIGGTTADIGLVVDGKPLTSTEGKVLKYPVRIPMLDVVSIGAGGGSIAWIDAAGSLHVGPQSAGAVPGPVCYGIGGKDPTVTDASVVLGYLDPDYFVGGELKLDAAAAHASLEEFGGRLGLSKLQVAHGIHTILNNRMADEIRLLTIARGYDPREFALVVLGGAGPVHGSPLARMLGIPRIIVPFAPGVLSAFGLLVSDIEQDLSLSFRRPARDLSPQALAEAFAQADQQRAQHVAREAAGTQQLDVRRYAEMRYVGQSYELEVPVEGDFDAGMVARLVDEFHRTHERIYRQRNDLAEVELVNLRTVWSARVPRIVLDPPVPGPSWKAAQRTTRKVYMPEAGGVVDVPVYRRDVLPVGVAETGPFIVEQADSTTIVLPGESCVVEPHGNMIVTVPANA